MTKKKETKKTPVSKKKQRDAKEPAKQDVNKWQEFLRRHSKTQEKKE